MSEAQNTQEEVNTQSKGPQPVSIDPEAAYAFKGSVLLRIVDDLKNNIPIAHIGVVQSIEQLIASTLLPVTVNQAPESVDIGVDPATIKPLPDSMKEGVKNV